MSLTNHKLCYTILYFILHPSGNDKKLLYFVQHNDHNSENTNEYTKFPLLSMSECIYSELLQETCLRHFITIECENLQYWFST